MPNPSGGEEADHIRAVVADPDRDEPRLAYADWLDAHGRRPRARLIRVQCQLEHLKNEERELLDRHAGEWGKRLGDLGADNWRFHRGFPEEVVIPIHHLAAFHERITEITPLRRLRVVWMDDAYMAILAGLPVLDQVRSLELGQTSSTGSAKQFSVEGVRTLAASPHLSGLNRLALHSRGIGATGAAVIAAAPPFQNLTHLTLTDPAFNRAGHKSFERVVTAMPGLHELQLGEIVLHHDALLDWRAALAAGLPRGPAGGRSR
jgi:uncharacterized protein (TIGR02996 family)